MLATCQIDDENAIFPTFATPGDPGLTDSELLYYKATISSSEDDQIQVVKEHWGTSLALNSEAPFAEDKTKSQLNQRPQNAGSFEIIRVETSDLTKGAISWLLIEKSDFLSLYTRSKIDPCLLYFVTTAFHLASAQSKGPCFPIFVEKNGNGRVQRMSGQLTPPLMSSGRILWSFEPTTLTTYVIHINDPSDLIVSEEFTPEIEAQISHICTGPYLLFMTIARLIINTTGESLERLFANLRSIESQTGHSWERYVLIRDREEHESELEDDLDDPKHMRLSSNLSGLLMNLEIRKRNLRYAEAVLAQIQKDYSALHLSDWYQAIPNGPTIETVLRTRFDRSMAEIINLVPLLQLQVTSLNDRAEVISSRANIQLTVVSSIVAHSDSLHADRFA